MEIRADIDVHLMLDTLHLNDRKDEADGIANQINTLADKTPEDMKSFCLDPARGLYRVIFTEDKPGVERGDQRSFSMLLVIDQDICVVMAITPFPTHLLDKFTENLEGQGPEGEAPEGEETAPKE